MSGSANIYRFLFKLPVQINSQQQSELIKYTQRSGYPCAMFFNGEKRFLWRSVLLRHLDYDKIEERVRNEFINEKRSIDFCLRNNLDLPWIWNPKVPSHLYLDIFEKLQPYILKLGRVQVLLQSPGQAIPMHSDLMPGQEYGDYTYKPIQTASIPSNNIHSENEYLTVKIPLTEFSGLNGYPTIEVDGQVYTYDVSNHAFVLDEYNIRHGAMASGHHRGVVVMDGLFDVQKMRQDGMTCAVTPVVPQNMFRRVMKICRPHRGVPFIGHDDGRVDIKAVVNEYSGMRLRSPHFFGAAFYFAEDGLSFVKHEFWRDEKTYRDFFFDNKEFIQSMIAMYVAEQESRNIQVTRTGDAISYEETTDLDKIAIKHRMFLSNISQKNQKFYD